MQRSKGRRKRIIWGLSKVILAVAVPFLVGFLLSGWWMQRPNDLGNLGSYHPDYAAHTPRPMQVPIGELASAKEVQLAVNEAVSGAKFLKAIAILQSISVDEIIENSGESRCGVRLETVEGVEISLPSLDGSYDSRRDWVLLLSKRHKYNDADFPVRRSEHWEQVAYEFAMKYNNVVESPLDGATR